MNWSDLPYWQSGEYQVIQERLQDYDKAGQDWCPGWDHLFRSLDCTPRGAVRAVVIGQDPYPGRGVADGVAFSVSPVPGSGDEPRHEGRVVEPSRLPPTLRNIFIEYQSDLGFPLPSSGDLSKWCEQGVLLWNTFPSCALGKPGSHHWPEWQPLTQQIVEACDEHVVPFVLLGRSAGGLANHITKSPCIRTSHPSPLGAKQGFFGSRIFSRVNQEIEFLNRPKIDWRLP